MKLKIKSLTILSSFSVRHSMVPKAFEICANQIWCSYTVNVLYFCIQNDLVQMFRCQLPSNMQNWHIFCTRCFNSALEQWHITGIDNKVYELVDRPYGQKRCWSNFHNEKGIIQMSSRVSIRIYFTSTSSLALNVSSKTCVYL